MTTIYAVRRLSFCVGHRVLNHLGKCSNMHGHNIDILIHAKAACLDEVGRVIDFSVLKDKLGGWIDKNLDHGFVVYEKDTEVLAALQVVKDQKIFILPMNPTSENIALYLLTYICPELFAGTGVEITKIELLETENCKAIVELEPLK